MTTLVREGWHVTATTTELRHFVDEGGKRTRESRDAGRAPRYGEGDECWISDAKGAIAEGMYRKFAGLEYLLPLNNFKGADAGAIVEVRFNGLLWGGVRVYPNDQIGFWVVGVSADWPRPDPTHLDDVPREYRIAGAVAVVEARAIGEWRAEPAVRRAHWLVSQRRLTKFVRPTTLEELIGVEA